VWRVRQAEDDRLTSVNAAFSSLIAHSRLETARNRCRLLLFTAFRLASAQAPMRSPTGPSSRSGGSSSGLRSNASSPATRSTRMASARGSATRRRSFAAREPVQLQLWVRIFCLQSRRTARCWAGPWAFYKWRDDELVQLICPTCQMFSRDRSKHPCWRQQATLHGVVFDILVGSGLEGGQGV
jgi:hypothetical protein